MDTQNNYKQRLSEAITWLRFPLIFFIIILHCYSVVKIEGSISSSYFKVVYPFALWLGETGVPGFFFISGYLFFLSKKSYADKLRTRIHTLLIPYILWNAILLALYIIVFVMGHPQIINNKDMADFGFIDYVRLFWDRGSFDDGNFVPLLCPFWYIRNLLIMSLLSPIIYFIIKYVREIFLLSIAVWWMITFNNAFIPQTILFFSIGAYFSILDINPLKMVTTNKKTFLAFFFLFAVADITMHTGWNTTIGLQVHRMALISNIPVLLFIADICVRKGFSNKLFPASAFFVFAVHYPIVVALRKTCAAKFTNSPDSIHVLLYFACVFVSILLSLSIYKFFDRYLPKAKSILSGNR